MTLYTTGQLCTRPCNVNAHSRAHLARYVLKMAAWSGFAYGGFYTHMICNRHVKAKFNIAHLIWMHYSCPCILGSVIMNRALNLQLKTKLLGCVPFAGLCVSTTALCNFPGLCTWYITIESRNPYFTNAVHSQNRNQC